MADRPSRTVSVKQLTDRVIELEARCKGYETRINNAVKQIKDQIRNAQRWKRRAAVRGSMVETLCEVIWKTYGRTLAEKDVKRVDDFPQLPKRRISIPLPEAEVRALKSEE